MLIKAHWLSVPAVAAIDRNSFAAKLIGKSVGLIDSGHRSLFAEVYGLADRGVTVLLKSGLHSNVPFRLDIVGTFENFAESGVDCGDFLNTAGFGNLFFQLFAIKVTLLGHLFEDWIYLQRF